MPTGTETVANPIPYGVPTQSAYFAPLDNYTFASGAGGAYVGDGTAAVAALQDLYNQVQALVLATNARLMTQAI